MENVQDEAFNEIMITSVVGQGYDVINTNATQGRGRNILVSFLKFCSVETL